VEHIHLYIYMGNVLAFVIIRKRGPLETAAEEMGTENTQEEWS